MEQESAGEDEQKEIEEKEAGEKEEASEGEEGKPTPEDEYYDEALALSSDNEIPPGRPHHKHARYQEEIWFGEFNSEFKLIQT